MTAVVLAQFGGIAAEVFSKSGTKTDVTRCLALSCSNQWVLGICLLDIGECCNSLLLGEGGVFVKPRGLYVPLMAHF